MKNQFKALGLAIIGSISLTISSHAGVSAAQTLGTTWIGTPTVMSGPIPNGVQFNVGENNWLANSKTNLAESFLATLSGTLNNIQLSVSGAPITNGIHLYDLGTGSNPSSYVAGTDLFSGLNFTYNGGPSQNTLVLTFSGVDQVNIVLGHRYVFEVAPINLGTPGGGGMTWYRGLDLYAGGSAYRGQSLLNGAERDMSLAVTIDAVPEPTSLALLGMGALALGCFRRRTK